MPIVREFPWYCPTVVILVLCVLVVGGLSTKVVTCFGYVYIQ